MNMKKGMTVVILALFACGAFAADDAAAAAQKAAAERKQASEKAWRELKKKNDDLVGKDFKGRFARYWHDSIDAARASYEAALKDPVYLNAQKIDICRAIANCRLEATRDEDGAIRDVEAATKLPGLTDAERAKAEANLKEVLVLTGRARRAPEPKKDLAACERVLANAKSEKDLGYRAVYDYVDAAFELDFDEMAKILPGKLREYQEKFPNRNVCGDFWGEVTNWRFAGRPLRAMLDRRFPAFAFDLAKRMPEKRRPSVERLFDYASKKRGALAAEAEALAPAVLKLAEDPKRRVNENLVKAAKKILAFKDVKGDVGRALAACRDFQKASGKEADKAFLADLLAEQARAFLAAGDEKGAKAIWAERAKIVPPRAQAALDCPWWADAPHDVRGIVESDFYKKAKKGLFTHRYGDNLKFLIETDSALTGRKMTTDKGESFRPTEVFAFCDDEGVKILMRSFDDNMADIRAGRAASPGYECYLATGIDDPYHCYMIDPAEGVRPGDSFVTQYDNGTGYRNVTTKRGNLRCDCLYLDDGVVTLVSVPWRATFASIPSKSPAWYFESIHWARGGLSWGGSQSVHHRSSFGELRFAGVGAKELTAIRRRLLDAAKGVWERAKNASYNGYVETWMDPELGDQDFYLAEVKPFVERIDADASRIRKEMTDAEVDEIYARSAETMLNVDYVVAAMRRDWLERKMTDGAGR